MAAPKENLLSLGHLTVPERNTKQRKHSLKKSVNRPMLQALQSHQHLRAMHLQQRWQELKKREFKAQQHNRQLLQQFEEAQDTLREMLTLNTAMKTIRMEYERYLEESAPRWQQQLKEKTQAAQKKRMEEYLKSCLKNTEERVTKSSADQPLISQGPSKKTQKIAAPQKLYSPNSHLDYNQDGSPHLPYMQSAWQTQPQFQTVRFPIRAPYQPQGSTNVPPSFLPPPIFSHPFQLHPLASMHDHHCPLSRQNPQGPASPQPDYPWSWAAGAAGIRSASESLWGKLYTEEPPPEIGVVQVVGEEGETSGALSSKRERGGGSRSGHSSQELDIKPVRLSSGPAESSESSRDSSQASREKRKKREKRGRSQRTSSDGERRSSWETSRTSSAIITAAVTVVQSSESDTSSEKASTSTSRRRGRSGGLAVGPPRAEKVVGERTGSNRDNSGSQEEENQSTGEESKSGEVGDQSADEKSESCREDSGSQREEESRSIQIENEGGDEIEKEERSSSEQSSIGVKEEEEHENGLGDEEEDDGDEKEDSQIDEKDVEEDEIPERKNTTEEQEDAEAEEESEEEEEKSDRLKNEDEENEKQGSDSSQDEEVEEDESEGGEEKVEEDGESDEEEEKGVEEEEEQRRDEGEPEERDSEDSIISPQNKSKKMHIIPDEASEDEDEVEKGSKTGSSVDDSNEFYDEDIEHLLAPQGQSQKKEEKDLRADEKPKAIRDKVEIFRVEPNRSTDHLSDSEFDNFYD